MPCSSSFTCVDRKTFRTHARWSAAFRRNVFFIRIELEERFSYETDVFTFPATSSICLISSKRVGKSNNQTGNGHMHEPVRWSFAGWLLSGQPWYPYRNLSISAFDQYRESLRGNFKVCRPGFAADFSGPWTLFRLLCSP